MEGAAFYWFAWIAWTITTFLMKKTKERVYLSIFLLLLIYASTFTFHIDRFSMNGTLLMLALISYAYIGMQTARETMYSMFVSVLLSLVYLGLYVIVINDPIWVMFSFHFFMALPVSLLSILMLKTVRTRLSVLISALIHGEVMYTIFMLDMHPMYVSGSFIFLNVVGVACGIVFLWTMYESFISKLKVKVDRPVKHVKEGVH